MVIFAALPWKLQQEAARKRPPYVMAHTKVAAEGGKKFCTSGFSLYLFFLSFFAIAFAALCVSSHASLHQVLPLSYRNSNGIHRGDWGMSLVHLSAEYLADLLLGAASTFFSFISVRLMVWPHSDYNKSCVISSHKYGTAYPIKVWGNS